MEANMNYKQKKKIFNVALVFALIFSLLTPFQNASKAADILTVAEAIANNSGTGKTVEGYIIGITNSGPTYQSTPPYITTNIAIADSPTEKDKLKILPVALPSGAIRTALNLLDHPENLGKKVQITGSLELYFGAPGLKSPTAYTIVVDTTPATQVEKVTASPAAGAVSAGTQVTLTSGTAGATIHYTIDGTNPTTQSATYNGPITINGPLTIKAIAVAPNLTNSDIVTLSYTLLTEKTVAEVRLMPIDSNVQTSGIVTAVLGRAIYFQDATAGLVAYTPTNSTIEPGSVISVKGKLIEFSGLLEIDAPHENITVTGTAPIPAAELLTAADFRESKEGTLVKVRNVTVNSLSSGTFKAVDGAGKAFDIRPLNSSILSTATTYEEITGVLGAFGANYQLIPRDASDIVQDSSVVQKVVATPGAGMIKKGDSVTLTTGTTGAKIYYTTDGSEPTVTSTEFTAPILINSDTTIKAVAVKQGLTNSEIKTFAYGVYEGQLRIRDIQGVGHYSRFDGGNVTGIEGIVTFIDGNNIFIQDQLPDTNVNTSEGILVYKSGHTLKVGDVVTVNGSVKEYYPNNNGVELPITEINATTITVTASDQTLPAPIVLGVDRVAPSIIDNDRLTAFEPAEDGIDFYESIEGMYVQINNAKVTAPQYSGEVHVIPGNKTPNTAAGGMRIDENSYNPEKIALYFNNAKFRAKMGDQFEGSITGVINYGNNIYRLLTKETSLPILKVAPILAQTTSIVPAVDQLTIASYNVENFSKTKTSAEKVEKVARAIVTNMKSPDIVGLIEVQDNDGSTDSGNVDGSESAAVLITKVKELGGPDYAYTEIAPVNNQDGGEGGGNIRVAFIYQPDRVSLTTGAPKGTATQAVGFENGKLTLNPGRIDPTNSAFNSSRKPLAAQFDFQGKSVIVVANHFNSKGGDQPLWGKTQPPVLSSEVQRHKIAQIVNNFVTDVKTKDPNANVVLLGDFNDFEFTRTLQILKGNQLTNMIDKVPAEDRYTYNFSGNAQVLDHILVTNNMVAKTKVDTVNVNSGYMEEDGRASDHDPVIIQTDLKREVLPPVPAPANTKVYNLVGYNTKKITVNNNGANITVGANSVIREGIILKGSYAKLQGEGLKNTVLILTPTQAGAVIDLSGAEVKEVIITNANISQIRGAENVQKWTVSDDVDTSNIKVTDVGGEVFPSPFFLQAPVNPVTPPPVPPVDNGTVSTYYANANGLTGASLKTALHNIIKVQTKITYDQVREALKDTDEDPNNPNNVILLYKGTSQAKSTFGGNPNDWNREHVWAQSHGNFGTVVGPGTDIHHLKPTDASVNSSRGNLDFDNGGTFHSECTQCKFDGDSWEAPDRVKGDIARMLMYMAVRYEGNGEIDLELVNYTGTTGALHGKLSTLLQWHAQDPVDAFEMRRNNVIYEKYQGNRNPFIDHPEYATMIWSAS
jgi:predicted extracellular nuclease/endonuclease I